MKYQTELVDFSSVQVWISLGHALCPSLLDMVNIGVLNMVNIGILYEG